MEYSEKPRPSKCLECGDKIVYGRQDRKFCCDTCKNTYNNRKKRGAKAAKARVMSALEKNYSILDFLLKHDITSMGVVELTQMGFKFDYVTSYHKIRRHDVYCCFDISFSVLASRIVAISRIRTEVTGWKE